jgi:D-beta-D-heptose 7-phosphate kinase/D-beta-D-heptose 1-phosphate adenosyltransferase
MRDPALKILSVEDAAAWSGTLRSGGRKLVLTNGCFDLLHRGHAEYLMKARLAGDALIVLLNSDASVRALKGPTRPVNNEADRSWLLASLEAVDAVCVFKGERCSDEIRAISPDVYVKGGDYKVESLDPSERDALFSVGAKILFMPMVAGLSTSKILEKAAR